MSDSNKVQYSILKESTRATTPAGNGQVINFASASFVSTPSNANSNSIRTDGNKLDVVRTDMIPSGSLTCELQHENNDVLYESVFRSAFETPISIAATTLSIDASGSPVTLDDSGNGLGALKPNDIIIVAGFTDSNNNGVFIVGGNTAAGSVDVIQMDGAKTPATEAAGDSVTVGTTRMENATTLSTFSIEEFNSASSIYREFVGMDVNTMTLPFGAAQLTAIAFTFQGNAENEVSATTFDGYDAATTNSIIDTENNYVGTSIGINGAAMAPSTACVTNCTYTVTNNSTRTKGLNCVVYSMGLFEVAVNLSIVFANKDVYDAFLNNQYISVASSAIDSSNQGIGIIVPKLKGLQVSPPVQGPNQTLIANVTGSGILNTSGSDDYSAIMSKLG